MGKEGIWVESGKFVGFTYNKGKMIDLHVSGWKVGKKIDFL